MTTTKTAKQVQVLCRYAHKTNGELNGIVTYCVKSSNNKDFYYTTLVNGRASGCGCPAKKPCYHMTQLVALEVVRAEKAAEVVRHNAEVAQSFAASVAPEWFVELVDAGTIVAPSHVETVSPKVVEVAASLDIPVAEVEAIAVIAAEHRKEMTEGKHTEMTLPIGPRESVKIGKVLLSDKSHRRRGGTLRQVEAAESLAALADSIYGINQRKAAAEAEKTTDLGTVGNFGSKGFAII